MDIREELLFDFAVNMPRILVAGRTVVIDNIKKIILFNDTQIVVSNGRKFTAVTGRHFVITMLREERMLVSGEVEEIRFFKTYEEDETGGEQ